MGNLLYSPRFINAVECIYGKVEHVRDRARAYAGNIGDVGSRNELRHASLQLERRLRGVISDIDFIECVNQKDLKLLNQLRRGCTRVAAKLGCMEKVAVPEQQLLETLREFISVADRTLRCFGNTRLCIAFWTAVATNAHTMVRFGLSCLSWLFWFSDSTVSPSTHSVTFQPQASDWRAKDQQNSLATNDEQSTSTANSVTDH
jgi:hypothetical protein